LSIITNAKGGSGLIPLKALAQLALVPIVSVSPVAIGFGNQVIGTTSTSQAVTVTNSGGVAAALNLAVSPDFLITTTTCGSTLGSLSSCSATIAMRPLGFGQRSGQLLVSSNAAGSPQVVNMVGTGCRPFTLGSNRVGSGLNCSP
jgi:hypothetical protein